MSRATQDGSVPLGFGRESEEPPLPDSPAHSYGVADQSGYIAHTAPTIAGGGGPAWSGFVIVMPWETYLRSGDEELLRAAYHAQLKLMGFWAQTFNR